MSNDVVFDIKTVEKVDNGQKYRVRIEIPTRLGWIDDVHFVIEKGYERIGHKLEYIEKKNGKAIFEGDIELETRAIYRYYFFYTAEGKPKHHKKEDYTNRDDVILSDEMWKMSVNYNVPEWAKGKIMYHIFVDRYKRGNSTAMQEMPRRTIHHDWKEEMIIGPNKDGIWNADFYGGDLLGIINKLDYIKSLGVSILYLSPIVYSQSNHRYDTSDYEVVDPYAGSNEDLVKLCDEAHKRGMKVILDAVFNHTGNDSKYFNEYGTFNSTGAYQNMNSPYTPFYRTKIENGILKYDYWWGMTNLPVCDGNSKEWQEYIVGVNGVIDKWFKLGIDGLRLDVADELTDEFIEMIRTAVKRNKEDGFILGEVWKDPMQMNRGYIENGKCMDSVMNYPLVDALIRYFKFGDIHTLARIIRNINVNYPDDTMYSLMNFTSTHDISRPLTVFGTNYFSPFSEWAWNPTINDLEFCRKLKLTTEEYEHGKEIYQAFVFALAFMPGILSIFYGDEAGIDGLGNLANRKTYPWGMEDKKLISYFQDIGCVRNSESYLTQASIKILSLNEEYFMFERVNGNKKGLFVVNRTNEERKIVIPSEYQKSHLIYSLKRSNKDVLTPYGAMALG